MKSKHFEIYELVPKHIYEKFGEFAWNFIDDRLIQSIDAIKEQFPKGAMYINNYKWGLDRNWSGFRTPEFKYYSPTSQHSHGRAADCIFTQYSVDEVREYIINNHSSKFSLIKGIEKDISWLHIDVRNSDKLVVFSKG
jgi:hypothetical protein